MDVKSEDERDPPPGDIHELSEGIKALKCSPRSLRCPSLNHDGADGAAGEAAVDATQQKRFKPIPHFIPRNDTPIPQFVFAGFPQKCQPVDSTHLEASSNTDTDTSESNESGKSDTGNQKFTQQQQPSSRSNKTHVWAMTTVFGDVRETTLCVSKTPYQEFFSGNDSNGDNADDADGKAGDGVVDLRAAAGVGVRHASNLDSIFRPKKRLKTSSVKDNKKSVSSTRAKAPPPAPCKPKK